MISCLLTGNATSRRPTSRSAPTLGPVPLDCFDRSDTLRYPGGTAGCSKSEGKLRGTN